MDGQPLPCIRSGTQQADGKYFSCAHLRTILSSQMSRVGYLVTAISDFSPTL
jgi:hypothetical protein